MSDSLMDKWVMKELELSVMHSIAVRLFERTFVLGRSSLLPTDLLCWSGI